MYWFKTHLNWTTVLAALGASLLGYVLAVVWNAIIEPSATIGPPIHLSQVRFLVSLFMFFMVLSLLAFMWILKRKNRSLLYGMFFVAAIVPMNYSLWKFQSIGWASWFIGFVILFSLENRSPDTQS